MDNGGPFYKMDHHGSWYVFVINVRNIYHLELTTVEYVGDMYVKWTTIVHGKCLLVHLDQRSRWTIAITWRPSSVNFSSFFSETTGPIGTKLSRNVPWMVLYKVSVFRTKNTDNTMTKSTDNTMTKSTDNTTTKSTDNTTTKSTEFRRRSLKSLQTMDAKWWQ
jgi:hypothetical protein